MRKAKHWWAALTAVALSAGLLAATAGAAAAQPAATVQDQVAALLRVNPGSHQVNANTIEVKPGVQISVPSGSVGVAADNCPYEWLCLYQHGGYNGAMIKFWNCRNEELRNYRLPDGRDWQDKASAYVNNQIRGTLAWPKDSTSPGSFYYWVSSAPERWSDLVNKRHPGGGNWNEKIDNVLVC
jgi:hypothetical protein